MKPAGTLLLRLDRALGEERVRSGEGERGQLCCLKRRQGSGTEGPNRESGVLSEVSPSSLIPLDKRQRSAVGQRYLRGSASRPSMALAVTVAGLARKIRASREPMRPW